MLEITTEKNNGALNVALNGRLDSATADQFEKEVNEHLDGVTDLIIDCANLEYISSAGLRVFLTACKDVSERGYHEIRNCNENVQGVFRITKLTNLLNVVQ